MSEPELTDAKDTPWGKLIYWSNEEVDTPTRRWNGVQRWVAELFNVPVPETANLPTLNREELEEAKEANPELFAELEQNKKKNPHVRPKIFIVAFNDGGPAHAYLDYTATFEGAQFLFHTLISVCVETDISFEHATFHDDVHFQGTCFKRPASFENALFKKKVNFISLQGKPALYFQNAIFEVCPPHLHGSELHPESSFQGAQFPKKDLPDHVGAYENLRQIAESIGKLEDRKIFIQREMECRYQGAERWSVDWMWRGLYRAISYHGTSVGRPFCIMACLFMFSLYFWIKWGVQTGQIGVFDALMLHFQQIMPLPRYDLLDLPKTLPDCLIFSASFLRVISFPAWFLIGLALRHRFRMG